MHHPNTTHVRARLHIVALLLAAPFACDIDHGGDAGQAGDGSSASDTAADSGDPQGNACVPNDSDGTTQCTIDTCLAGNYCEVDGACAPGCRTSLNCGEGEYCDLRAPAPNWDHSFEIGVCRAPGAECGVDTNAGDTEAADSGAMNCDEVQGNYAMYLSDDSPSICHDAFSGLTMCSVAQEGCGLTWGCDANFGLNFPPGELEGDTYHGGGSYMGVPFDCTIEFVWSQTSVLTFSCAANVGQAVVCTGWGA